MKKTHSLKTWPEYFQKVVTGEKTFEVRKNDRDFEVGDILILKEYIHDIDYTGRSIRKEVAYILKGGSFGIVSGYCILGFKS